MAMRYVAAFFLVVLLLIILGIITGYLSLNLGAPLDRQLMASGALATYWACDDNDCHWMSDETDETGPGSPSGAYDVVYEDEVEPVLYEEWWLEHGDGPIDAWDHHDVVDEWEEPLFTDHPWYPEWTEDEYWIYEPQKVQNPWYVNAFPGIGQIAQHIVPGLNPAPRPAPPAPPPRPTYPQPSCWISALSPIVEYGGSSTLSWSTFNATRASLTDFGNVPLSGSRLVQNIRNDRTYQLSVVGQGGSGSCYTRITVRPQSSAPSCVISAYPSAIHVGESSSLAWGSNNASSAYLSGVGTVAPQGGTYVSPRQTTTYTLSVFGSEGKTGSCTAQIGVLP